jgi:hypothetical protein
LFGVNKKFDFIISGVLSIFLFGIGCLITEIDFCSLLCAAGLFTVALRFLGLSRPLRSVLSYDAVRFGFSLCSFIFPLNRRIRI